MSELKTYSYDEAYRATLAYFDGDELAARVWVNKYAMKDSAGNIYEQTPTDMHWRIANEIARIENNYDNPMSAQEVFDVIDHFRYIVPAGSPMTGIGNNHQVASLSNCFVIGLDRVRPSTTLPSPLPDWCPLWSDSPTLHVRWLRMDAVER